MGEGIAKRDASQTGGRIHSVEFTRQYIEAFAEMKKSLRKILKQFEINAKKATSPEVIKGLEDGAKLIKEQEKEILKLLRIRSKRNHNSPIK